VTAAVPRLGSIVLDTPDPEALAGFYARILDWPAEQASPQEDGSWVTLKPPYDAGVVLDFQRVDGYRRPTWPTQDVPQQFHLDLTVDDLPAAHERAVELGAEHVEDHPTFRVYLDPDGHPFCLCAC
jgi:catechol 2,3-dioxygenase-like lactoylglutathione lyase family enzyme